MFGKICALGLLFLVLGASRATFAEILMFIGSRNLFGRVIRKLHYWYAVFVERDPLELSLRNWYADAANERMRYDFPLGPESVVWDLGGYLGEWSREIYDEYHSRICIFEPVGLFSAQLSKRFSDNEKVRVFPLGLSDRDGEVFFSVKGEGSSGFQRSDDAAEEKVRLRDIAAFFKEEGSPAIELFKINIEGGEYDVLPRMIETGVIRSCRYVLIQFHNFVENSEKMRFSIQQDLRKTHELVFEFPFVWELWERLRAAEVQQ